MLFSDTTTVGDLLFGVLLYSETLDMFQNEKSLLSSRVCIHYEFAIVSAIALFHTIKIHACAQIHTHHTGVYQFIHLYQKNIIDDKSYFVKYNDYDDDDQNHIKQV